MVFDEEHESPTIQSQKIGLKKVSSQKSIFETMPKKPNHDDFVEQVKIAQERKTSYMSKTAELSIQFNKMMADKTLSANKNLFQKEMEIEALKGMIKLAQEINSDTNEREGEGSLSWIALLLKTSFNQRDKINNLEYSISQLEKKTDPAVLNDLILKALDNKK